MCFAIESRARIKANGGIKREIQNTKQIFIILEFWCPAGAPWMGSEKTIHFAYRRFMYAIFAGGSYKYSVYLKYCQNIFAPSSKLGTINTILGQLVGFPSTIRINTFFPFPISILRLNWSLTCAELFTLSRESFQTISI